MELKSESQAFMKVWGGSPAMKEKKVSKMKQCFYLWKKHVPSPILDLLLFAPSIFLGVSTPIASIHVFWVGMKPLTQAEPITRLPLN
jgi:hypothetical protein